MILNILLKADRRLLTACVLKSVGKKWTKYKNTNQKVVFAFVGLFGYIGCKKSQAP